MKGVVVVVVVCPLQLLLLSTHAFAQMLARCGARQNERRRERSRARPQLLDITARLKRPRPVGVAKLQRRRNAVVRMRRRGVSAKKQRPQQNESLKCRSNTGALNRSV